jgi:hypothetical protein
VVLVINDNPYGLMFIESYICRISLDLVLNLFLVSRLKYEESK